MAIEENLQLLDAHPVVRSKTCLKNCARNMKN